MSLIDPRFPIFGTPETETVREQLRIARDEISELQRILLNAPFLPLAGGTEHQMLGPLLLLRDPQANYEAANKQYVDALAFGGGAGGGMPDAPKDGRFFARGGQDNPALNNEWSSEPLFEMVTLGRDPKEDMEAANKGFVERYVDSQLPDFSNFVTDTDLASAFEPFTEATGSGNVVRQNGPTINQPVVKGVTDGSNAAPGAVREYLTDSASNGNPPNAAAFNLVSLPLPAGDWNVWGAVAFIAPGGAAVFTALHASINTASAAQPSDPWPAWQTLSVPNAPIGNTRLGTGVLRHNSSEPTTVYLNALLATSTTTTPTVSGVICARRV